MAGVSLYHYCQRQASKTDEREREMFYLTTHSTHFIYGYMASYIWLRTILIVRKETRCRHICYSFRLTARILLYAPSHRQDSTYHGLCYTSRGALAGTRNSSMGPPHEGSIRRPIAPWANVLTMVGWRGFPVSLLPEASKQDGRMPRIVSLIISMWGKTITQNAFCTADPSKTKSCKHHLIHVCELSKKTYNNIS